MIQQIARMMKGKWSLNYKPNSQGDSFVIPTRNLIVDFAKIVSDIMQQMRYLKHSVLKLTQARDILLPWWYSNLHVRRNND